MLDDYVFIYKDAHQRYNLATSAPFIAGHKCCRAVPKNFIKGDFDTWSDFMMDLNSEAPSLKAKHIIFSSHLREIYPKDSLC